MKCRPDTSAPNAHSASHTRQTGQRSVSGAARSSRRTSTLATAKPSRKTSCRPTRCQSSRISASTPQISTSSRLASRRMRWPSGRRRMASLSSSSRMGSAVTAQAMPMPSTNCQRAAPGCQRAAPGCQRAAPGPIQPAPPAGPKKGHGPSSSAAPLPSSSGTTTTTTTSGAAAPLRHRPLATGKRRAERSLTRGATGLAPVHGAARQTGARSRLESQSSNGSVAERFKAAVLKTAEGVTLP